MSPFLLLFVFVVLCGKLHRCSDQIHCVSWCMGHTDESLLMLFLANSTGAQARSTVVVCA